MKGGGGGRGYLVDFVDCLACDQNSHTTLKTKTVLHRTLQRNTLVPLPRDPQHGSMMFRTASPVGHPSFRAGPLSPLRPASRRGHGLGRGVNGGEGVAEVLLLL